MNMNGLEDSYTFSFLFTILTWTYIFYHLVYLLVLYITPYIAMELHKCYLLILQLSSLLTFYLTPSIW